jgi:hypothetical protein
MYKVGQKVRVIANVNKHDFAIGEIVTVRELDADGNIDSCENENDYWFIDNEEVEPVEEDGGK